MTERAETRSDWIQATGLRNVGASGLMTTRRGGVSIESVYGGDGRHGGGMNLGVNCHDSAVLVAQNRALLARHVGRPIVWLRQVHGNRVHRIASNGYQVPTSEPEADAAVTNDARIALAVLTADCLPVLLAAPGLVGVAHAGWRGLASDILNETVKEMQDLGAKPSEITAWFGAAIGADAYEVGRDVYDAFCSARVSARQHFRPVPGLDKWTADLNGLAIASLRRAGVVNIAGGNWCTMTDSARFFSYRREKLCGRMASLVWIDSAGP